MTFSTGQILFVLIYFFYGLAFFTLGISLTLEVWRSSSFNERQALRPLALFGLMHGMHEWLEIVMIQAVWIKAPFPLLLSWIRTGWLSASFVPLVLFGVIMLNRRRRRLNVLVVLTFIAVFLALAALQPRGDQALEIARIDALARYVLAIPGGLIAGLAVFQIARRVSVARRPALVKALYWAAGGFILYACSQVFVGSVAMFPANVVNSALFMRVFGFPIQLLRAGAALMITVNTLSGIRVLSEEREAQLNQAKQARLEALERVQQELEQREVMRRELLRHTVQAQEEERSRIARELHDETAQLITAFSMNLASLQMSLPKRSEVSELARRLQDQSRQLSQGIYRLVRDLRPAQLDDLGLIPALQYLVDDARQRLSLQVNLAVEGKSRRLDTIIETVIFRVAQEALTNVGRHARVGQAGMRVVYDPGEIRLWIRDEGIGFDPHAELRPPHGWGLAGMRERVESVGGDLVVESAPGQGTTVEVKIPLLIGDTPVVESDEHGEVNPVDLSR
ncbi:MAG TPA: sensor histidine kinase [Anaerolineales bacterium]